ncbi:MAG TPA: arginase family protein [Thermomicrobiales bacterium]|jgi:arginase
MRLQIVTVPYRYDERNAGPGAGPDALLTAGLVARLTAAGHEVLPPREAVLDPHEREDGRTALNIGHLGAKTAALVAAGRRDGDAILILAGDDTAAVGVVSGLQQADGAGTPIGLVWLDAHGDFNTPETSISGILAGMPVAILAGLAGPNWRGAAGLAAPVPTDRIVIAGVRDLDDKEAALLRSTSVRLVPADKVRKRGPYADAVARLARNCAVLSLHLDLDVLDPDLVPSASTPSAGGLDVDETAETMAVALRTGKVATVVVSSLNPGGAARGRKSIETALAVIERALAAWEQVPATAV